MNEDVKLPTTVEEFQRELRDAYRAGAYSRSAWRNPEVEKAVEVEARLRYPIRKKVTRKVTDSTGFTFRAVSNGYGRLIVQMEDGVGWQSTMGSLLVTEERARIWADLLANPFEEVEE